jgi:hypothetical protein
MSRLGSLLTKIQSMFTDYCEFRDICPYFDPDQFTCVNSGGSRCGKYRHFKAEKAAVNEQAKPKRPV